MSHKLLAYRIGHIEMPNLTASVVHRPADNGVTLVMLTIPCARELFTAYRVHGSIGAITILGVAHESYDTIIVSTPEAKEETGD